jgi:hypothetical protein
MLQEKNQRKYSHFGLLGIDKKRGRRKKFLALEGIQDGNPIPSL